ncbi:MAG: hypothetical protein ACRD21_00105 [Vicinamibacteria bacterium]
MTETISPKEQHVTILGILCIVFGALGLMTAVLLGALFGGAAGIVGMVARSEPDAVVAVPILGTLGALLFLLIALLSLPGLAVGIGLIKRKKWARVGGLVLSVLNLVNFPFGTALGAYGLWVLLDSETEAVFH